MIDRAGLYGDLIFETIRVRDGKICFADRHYNRLCRGAQMLKFDISSLSEQVFRNEILKALNGKSDARIRFVLQRDAEGFYTPSSNRTKFSVDVFQYHSIHKICHHLGLYTAHKKSCDELSNLKSGNALVSVLAAIYNKENELDDCIFLNQNNSVAEAISSNIFLVKNKSIITPPLTEGCVEGVMRQVVIEIATQKSIPVMETPIKVENVLDADEIFLTNAIDGIVPVEAFQSQKYSKQFITQLKSILEL